MDFQKINIFLHLAESLNFSQTAENMHISQPAVTKAIRSLEEELCVALFNRGKRFVRLTDAGRSFYEDCRIITSQMETAVDRARNIAQRSESTLSIGYTGTYLETTLFPGLIDLYNQRFENVSIYLIVSNHTVLQQQLLDGQCSFIFTTIDDITDFSRIQFTELMSGNFVCILPASHPYAAREMISVDDLNGEKLILFNALQAPPKQTEIQNMIKNRCGRAQFYYTDSIMLSHTMVLGGIGISIMPSFVTLPGSDEFHVVPLDIQCCLTYGIARRKDTPEKMIRESADIAVEYFSHYALKSSMGNPPRPSDRG